MSPEKKTFVDRCLAGEALVSDVDDYVAEWHEGNDSRSLSEYLGMTKEEYGLWVQNPYALKAIICARKGMPLVDAIEWACFGVAARAPSRAEAQKILEWLRETGRLT